MCQGYVSGLCARDMGQPGIWASQGYGPARDMGQSGICKLQQCTKTLPWKSDILCMSIHGQVKKDYSFSLVICGEN